MCKDIIHKYKHGGALTTALYYKQCSSSLMKAYGGIDDKAYRHSLSFPISLTRKGYPRVIPSFHRLMIYRHDEKADMLVRYFLFTVCRIILVAPAVSKKTFKTIVSEPSISVDSLRTIVLKLRKKVKTLFSRSLPAVTSIPLHTGVRWLPTFKSLPTMGEYASALIRRKRIDPHRRRAAFSSFCVEAYERYSFTVLLMMNVSNGYGSYGPLSVKTTRFAFDEVGNKVLDKLCSSLFNDYTLAFSNVSSVYEMLPVRLGMLGCSFPGSGKRRIFAIGNYVIQRMLKGPVCFFIEDTKNGWYL